MWDLGHNASNRRAWDQLVLESKENMAKRGFASPDDGDPLALTFARPVAPVTQKEPWTHSGSTLIGRVRTFRLKVVQNDLPDRTGDLLITNKKMAIFL
jgi:hypothetical protein